MTWHGCAPAYPPDAIGLHRAVHPNGRPRSAIRSGLAYEIKHDGYRLVARLEARRVRLFSRRGHEWSDRFPRICEALASLRVRSVTIDGEVVVLCPKTGLSRFR